MIRPIEHLRAAMRLYPGTSRLVDEFRADRGNGLPDWPAWCFLPMAGWYAIVSNDNADQMLPGNRLPPHLIGDVGKLAALGTWRYSQGVYQLDADLQAAIADTIIVGEMPSEVLFRLPEWCVYIETPGRQWLDNPLHGFWCHLEYDINTGRNELRLLLDTDEALIAVPVHIGPWTVTEAIDRAVGEAKSQANAHNLNLPVNMDHIQQLAASINPLISMLLYLCSDEPDIDDLRQPRSSPYRPHPKKTKNGWRLFPPDKPRIWTVGGKLGEQLRHAQANIAEQSGRSVKAHLRRGHWHGYWAGSRDKERRFFYRWIMPMVVAGGIND